jgi:hypothetical protein
MEILSLITLGYALGIALCGVMAYLGIKGTNEAIDFKNRQSKLTESFDRQKQMEFKFDK